jgi:hypothetical protein
MMLLAHTLYCQSHVRARLQNFSFPRILSDSTYNLETAFEKRAHVGSAIPRELLLTPL